MNRVISTIGLALVFGLVMSASSQAEEPATPSIEQIKKQVSEKKAVLLDVREKGEWDDAHLKLAELFPLSKIKEGADPKDVVKDLKKDTVIYCHCRAGRRAAEAAEILKKKGYKVQGIKAGYDDLIKAGFEQVKK